MKRSNRLMLLVGVLLAVVAFGGVLMFGSRSGTSAPAPADVAASSRALRDIGIGTRPDRDRPGHHGYAHRGCDRYLPRPGVLGDASSAGPSPAGQPFTSADFQSGSVNALDVTTGLKAGQRAMAVSVDSLSGVGSLIQAGDYVDVMLAIPTSPIPTRPQWSPSSAIQPGSP